MRVTVAPYGLEHVEGLLALHQVTGEPAWLERARHLLDDALTRFADGAGGFFDTADDAEQLVRRPQDPTDGPAPSGAGPPPPSNSTGGQRGHIWGAR